MTNEASTSVFSPEALKEFASKTTLSFGVGTQIDGGPPLDVDQFEASDQFIPAPDDALPIQYKVVPARSFVIQIVAPATGGPGGRRHIVEGVEISIVHRCIYGK